MNFWSDKYTAALAHGGRLNQAVATSGIARDQWLDLSAALNPAPYPVPMLAPELWQTLPEDDDALLAIAQHYYQCSTLLPVAGSQQAIQLLASRARLSLRVGVLANSYAEHAHVWGNAGHRIHTIGAACPPRDERAIITAIEQALPALDVLILVNPNNPTGQCFEPAQLLRWLAILQQRGGCLIVDEAFIDSTPQQSLTPHCPRSGLIVLRSLGKFFGLAGARVGFVAADTSLLHNLQSSQGPWPLSHPSRAVASLALADTPWQQAQRQRLPQEAARLQALLRRAGFTPSGCSLFQYCPHPQAAQRYQQLLQQAVLVRYFPGGSALRFALPPAAQWLRLTAALETLT